MPAVGDPGQAPWRCAENKSEPRHESLRHRGIFLAALKNSALSAQPRSECDGYAVFLQPGWERLSDFASLPQGVPF